MTKIRENGFTIEVIVDFTKYFFDEIISHFSTLCAGLQCTGKPRNSLFMKKIRQFNSLVISLLNTTAFTKFLRKSVRENFCIFHTVNTYFRETRNVDEKEMIYM